MAAGGFLPYGQGRSEQWFQYTIPFLECIAIWGRDSQVNFSLPVLATNQLEVTKMLL